MKRDSATKIVDTLYELGTLRHVQRSWRQFGGVNFANVAEHSFRVCWLAMILAEEEGADVGKVLQMALLHDVSEIRTGDVNYVSRMYTERNEDNAIDDTFSGLSIKPRLQRLWEELESKASLEARIVKDADILDCDLELQEQAANGVNLAKVLQNARLAASKKLTTATGQRLFQLILKSDPHSWHTLAKNRLTDGDWSE